MAAHFGGWPHEVWAFPYHYFVALRKEYLAIVNNVPVKPGTKSTKGAGGITIETFET